MEQTEPPNPWGSCFDATASNFLANMEAPGLRVCHGIGIASRKGQEGKRIAHAWLEFDHEGQRWVMDCVWLRFVPAAKYRADFQLEYIVEYTPDEFMRLWRQHNYPGAWDEKIKPFASNFSPDEEEE